MDSRRRFARSGWRPLVDESSRRTDSHGLSPYDFAAIYDVQTLWNQGYDGSGQVIGIAGHTNIKPSDIASFRSEPCGSGSHRLAPGLAGGCARS
jgi:hypothetical protein